VLQQANSIERSPASIFNVKREGWINEFESRDGSRVASGKITGGGKGGKGIADDLEGRTGMGVDLGRQPAGKR